MSPSSNYSPRIELNRKLHLETGYYFWWSSSPNNITYEKALSNKDNIVTVILGEKGSGKTTELKHHFERLNESTPNSALLLRLDQLTHPNYEIKKLTQWNANIGEKFLFLDSIDECRLKYIEYQDAFELALKNLKSKVAIHEKTRIFITSRLSAWNNLHDTNLIYEFVNSLNPAMGDRINKSIKERTLNLKERKDEFHNVYLVYTIDKLNKKQILHLAEHYYQDSGKRYIQVLQNFPASYYDTPVECIDSLRYISRYGELPKDRTEFLATKLHSKYRELNAKYSYSERLTMKEVEKYSQRAAIATLLCQTLSFRAISTYESISAETSINNISLDLLFPDVEIQSIQHFSNSNLFISNDQYGSIKFCSEPLRDYAAYLWLRQRFVYNEYDSIFRLIFNEIDNKFYPKESFIIPCIMLSNSDRRIQKILIENCPELLLRHAEYCQFLIPSEKLALLNDLCTNEQHRLRTAFSHLSNIENAAAFFSLDFECVSELLLLLDGELTLFTKAFIYSMLQNQPWESVAADLRDQVVQKLLQSAISNDRLLLEHIIPIFFKIPDLSQERRKLYEELCENGKRLTYGPLMQYISIAYPGSSTIEEVLHILECSKLNFYEKIIALNPITQFLYADDCTILQVIKCTRQMIHNDAIAQYLFITALSHVIENDMHLESQAEWLSEVFFKISLKYYNNEYCIINAIRDLRNKLSREHVYKLLEKIFSTNIEEKRVFHHMNQSHLFLWCEYKDYLLGLSLNASVPWGNSISILDYFFKLSLHTGEHMDLVYYADDFEKMIYLNKTALSYKSQCKETQSTDEETQHSDDETAKSELIINCLRQQDKIKKACKSVHDCMTNLLCLCGSHSRLSDLDDTQVKELTSESFYQDFCLGLDKVWRDFEVDINDEKFYRIGTDLELYMLILSGIQVSYKKKGEHFINNDKEINIAAIAGLHEMNELPEWYDYLLLRYKMQIRPIIIKALDCFFMKSEETMSRVLSLLFSSSAFADSDYYEIIFDQCRLHKKSNLSLCIKYLIEHESSDYENVKLLILECLKETENEEYISLYLSLLLRVDYKSFIIKLQSITKDPSTESYFYNSILVEIAQSTESMQILIDFIENREWRFLIEFCSMFNGVELYEEQNDDLDLKPKLRKIEAYHERLFDQIYSVLQNQYLEFNDRSKLYELAESYPDPILGEMIKSLADMTRHRNDAPPLTERDVVQLEENDYSEPKCTQDLYHIVCGKLNDIKYDSEAADFSNRDLYSILSVKDKEEIISKQKKEVYFQKLMLMELRYRSNKLYSAVREVEVDRNKKPDLQIWWRNMCVTIECKIANAWSYNDLKISIKDQLIGQYLKHPQYSHGVFLLAKIGEDRKWRIDGKNEGFDVLVQQLQKYADTIIREEYPGVQEIRVIGIDYDL